MRSWIVEMGRKALSAQPDTITLSRIPGARWRNPAAAERLIAPLREKGFVDLGIYDFQPKLGFRLGVMLSERNKVAAFLNELPTGSIALELSVRYLDGTTTALVNYANNGVPRPPFFRVIFAGPEASSGELYERLLRERPPSGIKTITADNVIAEYQAAYARMMAFVKGRGLSAEEVAEIAVRARRPIINPPSQKPSETVQHPEASVPIQPAIGAGAKDIRCPHCGQINERHREVCWACYKLLRGKEKIIIEPQSYQDRPTGPLPEPLREQLAPNEHLLWHGRPRDKLDLRSIPLIALPVTWAGGALMMWLGGTFLRLFKASWQAGLAGMIFGVLCMVAGFCVLLGPFLQRFLRRGTFYAVTDRRVIIVHERPFHRVIIRDLSVLTVANVCNETRDGWGDIELGFAVWTSARSDFEFIENVREVAALLHLAQPEAAARRPSGDLAGNAPAFLARLIVPLHYSAIALYLLLALCDLKAIFQSRGRILATWAANQDTGSLPPATVLFVVPVMMFFFYSRAKKFEAGTRVARTSDVALMAVFVILGSALLFWGDILSLPQTSFYVILGVFALLVTHPGTAIQAGLD